MIFNLAAELQDIIPKFILCMFYFLVHATLFITARTFKPKKVEARSIILVSNRLLSSVAVASDVWPLSIQSLRNLSV